MINDISLLSNEIGKNGHYYSTVSVSARSIFQMLSNEIIQALQQALPIERLVLAKLDELRQRTESSGVGFVAECIVQPNTSDEVSKFLRAIKPFLGHNTASTAAGASTNVDAAVVAHFTYVDPSLRPPLWENFLDEIKKYNCVPKTNFQNFLFHHLNLSFLPRPPGKPLHGVTNQAFYKDILTAFPESESVARPHPDGIFGYTTAIFPGKPWKWNIAISEFRVNKGNIYLPYLIVEVEGPMESLQEAKNKCCGGMAMALRLTNSLLPGEDNVIFGLLLSSFSAEITVMWTEKISAGDTTTDAVIDGDVATERYIMRTIRYCCLSDLDGYTAIYHFVTNLHNWALGERRRDIEAKLVREYVYNG